MTTLAYRDNILAADTQCTMEGSTKIYYHKLTVLSNGNALASAGDVQTIEQLKRFLLGEKKRPPKMKGKQRVSGIYIQDRKPYSFDESCILVPIDDSFYADGSGWKFALAAMHMDLSAIQAIELASELDVNTNNVVDWYNIKTGELHSADFKNVQHRRIRR